MFNQINKYCEGKQLEIAIVLMHWFLVFQKSLGGVYCCEEDNRLDEVSSDSNIVLLKFFY